MHFMGTWWIRKVLPVFPDRKFVEDIGQTPTSTRTTWPKRRSAHSPDSRYSRTQQLDKSKDHIFQQVSLREALLVD